MVEARGVEPLSLKPSAKTYYKFSQCYLSRASSLTTTHEAGGTLFILDSSPFLVFFARYRRPSSLTSIQSRTGSLRSYSSFFSPAELSENRVSFVKRRSHINIIGS